jgi:DNA-binding SARP family transcriptional activator/tetratricopeptide (TPR) repeat protein
VEQAGTEIPIRASKVRTLLAALLMEANTPVSMDRLVDAVWQGRPPASNSASMYNHMMRLRRFLGEEADGRIRAVAPGYLIRVEPGELDSDRFVALCAEGRAAAQGGDWDQASGSLSSALQLWYGQPLADVVGMHGYDSEIQQLVEARTQALEDRIEADLHLGRHHEVISELRALAMEHPLREGVQGRLMLALYRANRQAEAIDAYHALRRSLADDLGVDPSPDSQRLYHRILDADPGLAVSAAPEPAPGAGRAGATAAGRAARAPGNDPRHQLPGDTRAFTGRARELEQLLALARKAPLGSDAGMVVISAIDGMAGIGKSALAVRAAHRLRGDFPDGQLFVDLHGHTPGIAPLTAAEALDGMLRSLGVSPQLIPQDLGERAAYYRDRLAGKRALILLDNAATSAQVRPLLPATPGCLVIVTSRRRLTGLDDAHSMALDTLSPTEAAALLHKAAGPGRIPQDHPAVAELVALCGHMPLAIRITGARLRHRRTLGIEDLVEHLRDEHSRLDQFKDQDRNLAAVFESSYSALLSAEQYLFRCLALVPGPEFDAFAAACLTGTDHRTAERLLESLLDQNLLIERAPGRYRFHDLVRLHARSLDTIDTPAERAAAVDRLYGYYQAAARAADRWLVRYTRPAADAGPAAESSAMDLPDLPDLPNRAAAAAWMRTERDNLLATVAQAEPTRALALTEALAAFLQQDGYWRQAAALHQTAAARAREDDDRLREAGALLDCGRVTVMTGNYVLTAELLEQSVALYRALGSRQGEANARQDLGRVRYMTGRYADAGRQEEQALAVFRELGDLQGEANALCELARVRQATGDYLAGADLLERALTAFRELGDIQGEANSLCELGRARLVTGDVEQASYLLDRALVLYRDLGQRQGEANILQDLGRVRHLTGRWPEAVDLHKQALVIYRALGQRLGEANALWELGRARTATGDVPSASDLLERSLSLYQDLGQRQGEANALHELGRVRQATGHHAAASDLLDRALALFHDVGDPQGEAEVLNSMGTLALETDGPEQALSRYRQARDLAREVHSPYDEARALDGAGRCAARLGDRRAAVAELGQAVALYRALGAAETAAAAAYLATLENEQQHREEHG